MSFLLSPLFSPARYGLLTGITALCVLLAVFVGQYGFGLHPCTLRLWQRYPYAALLILGFGLHYCACKRPTVFVFVLLIMLAWLASFGLGLFHTGVEKHWWEFHSACSGTIYEAGASADDLLQRLKAAPVTRCDQPADFLFGWSMAIWNAGLSAAMTLFSMIMAVRFYRLLFKRPAAVSGI